MSEIWILFNQPIPLVSALGYFPFAVIFDLIVRKKDIKKALLENSYWTVFLLICVYFKATFPIILVIFISTLFALKIIVGILKALNSGNRTE